MHIIQCASSLARFSLHTLQCARSFGSTMPGCCMWQGTFCISDNAHVLLDFARFSLHTLQRACSLRSTVPRRDESHQKDLAHLGACTVFREAELAYLTVRERSFRLTLARCTSGIREIPHILQGTLSCEAKLAYLTVRSIPWTHHA